MAKPVQSPPAYLAGPIDASQTSIAVRGLKDSRGNPIVSMISSKMHATIEPRSLTNQEIISWTGMTDLGGGLVRLDSVTRNLNPQPPYTAMVASVPHSNGVELILSDTAALWNEYPNVNETKTINALWNFGVRPRIDAADSDPTAAATKQDIIDASIGELTIGRIIVAGEAGEAVVENQVVWLDPATGTWKVANGNVLAELDKTKLGVALSTTSSGLQIEKGVALSGQISGLALSSGPVYVSNSGMVSNSPGTNLVQIGIAVNGGTDIIFDPLFKQIPSSNQVQAMEGGGILGTPSATNKFLTQNYTRFGGTGADGALSVSSGATTINLGGQALVIKNYTNISITGTGYVNFSNPHSNGTIIILKSQGNVVITSSATAAIDTRGAGAAAATSPTGLLFDGATLQGQSGNSANEGLGGSPAEHRFFYTQSQTDAYRPPTLLCGAGGGNGGTAISGGSGYGGSGGRGGGALLIQCGGTLDFTGTINSSGSAGTDGTGSSNRGSGGAGGGSAGTVVVLANTINTNTGTINSSGGSGTQGGPGSASTGSAGRGGGGAGSLMGSGGAGNGGNGGGGAGVVGGLGAGGGGNAGGSSGVQSTPATGGGSMGGLVAVNTELF